jgi:hypothetical protein
MYGIEFMSFVYLVVYIGAIAILFLFMIMMLNVNSVNSLPSKTSISLSFLYICLFLKFIYFIFLVNKNIFLFYLETLQCLLLETSTIYVNYKSGVLINVKEGSELFGIELITNFKDEFADLLISGLNSSSDLIYICSLCVTSYI